MDEETTKKVNLQIARMIDHTLLKPDTTQEQIEKLTASEPSEWLVDAFDRHG